MVEKILLELARFSGFATLMLGWLLAFVLYKVNSDPALSICLAVVLCAGAGGLLALASIASPKIDIWQDNNKNEKKTDKADKLIAASSFAGALLISVALIATWIYSASYC